MVLGIVKTDGNGEMELFKSLLGTYGIIFIINLLMDVLAIGGLGALTLLIFGDALVRALFITLVIYAGNKGITWKEERG